MAILSVTPAQRVLLEALDATLGNALGYGVNDGTTKFIEEQLYYLGRLSTAQKLELRNQLLALAAAATSTSIFQQNNFMSMVDYGLNCGANFSTFAQPYTDGCMIQVTGHPLVLKGVRIWWDGAGSRTVRCSLWDGATTRLAVVDIAVTTAGAYSAIFASPVTLTPYSDYRITKRDQSASHEWYATSGNISTKTSGLIVAAHFYQNGVVAPAQAGAGWVRINGCFSPTATDVFPSSADATNIYFVDPIFV